MPGVGDASAIGSGSSVATTTGQNPMAYESPRIRRLRSDLAALERLKAESTVFRFKAVTGTPPQHYVIGFAGKSLAREKGKVVVRDFHEVDVKLGASYPRTMPELRWLTPIYHPNISEIGMICLGAYGTHWVPSLALDELCVMLWDMARYQNYDIRSPYNREAALWTANQTAHRFPMDGRPLRDLRTGAPRVEPPAPKAPEPEPEPHPFEPIIELDDTNSVVVLDMEVDLRPSAPRPPREPLNLFPNAPARPTPPPVQEDVIFLD